MKYKKLLLTLFVVVCTLNSNAQLLQWNTFGNIGTETTEPSVANNANIAASNLTQGTITAAANGNRFGGSNWWNTGNTVAGNTISEAVAGNDYIEFIVTPNVGFTFTPTSFVFNWDKSGTGPQNVVLRSSVDSYVANIGTVAPTAAIGTSNTITISGLTNLNSATTFRLYGYGATGTGGTGGFDIGSNVVNVVLNGTTASAGPYSVASGDWANPATWSTNPSIPLSSDNVTITAGHTVYTNATITRNAATYVNGAFEIQNGGWATGTTNFSYNTVSGFLNFNTTGSYNVSNTDIFWPASTGRPNNVSVLQGGLTMASNAYRSIATSFTIANGGFLGVTLTTNPTLTINGICRINNGGFFNTGASPIFGASSTLIYNTGGTYGRGLEWSALGVGTIGVTAGYPNNIQVSNNTTVDYINGAVSGAVGIKALAGNLTIDAGSFLHMNYGSVSAGGALIAAGNVTIAGTLTLGFAVNDDLKLAGNFVNTGTFNGNSRAVFFTKTGTQTVSSSTALTIPYVVTSGGGTIVQLLSNLIISSTISGGNVVSFGNAADIIDLNGNTLTLGSIGNANIVLGSGTFKGTTTSNLTLLGTGSIGILNFTTGFQNLGTFVMNRTAAATGCVMGTAVTINTALTLTAGYVDLGATTMTLASTVAPVGSSNSFVIADATAGGVLRKNITAFGVQSFPVGDKLGTIEYSPATVNFSAGTFTNAYFGISVQDFALATGIHPNLDASANWISRYWAITTSGTFTGPTYTFTGVYLDSDINGTEASCGSNQWDGTSWTYGIGVTAATNTLSIGTTVNTVTNHITAGTRDAEINVVQGATNYLHTSTYNFGTVLTSSVTDVVFTVQNLGYSPLTLLGPNSITGAQYSFAPGFALTTGNLAGPAGTRNFTIRLTAPLGAGTYAGSISIPNGDTSGGEAPYVINFTSNVIVPAPEINVKGFTGGTNSIVDGDITPSGLDNTLFGSVALGSNVTKDYEIQNTGTAVLTLSGTPTVTIGGTNLGDFTVTTFPVTSSIATSTSTTFIITFAPLAAGVRTATVFITSNDADEATYNYDIQGTGTCLTANTITPTSGPVGTEVTITATSNNLTGTTVTFNGTAAVSITYVSSTVIKILVPSGATSGNLITTNTQGCTANTTFTVLNTFASNCQPGNTVSELFISEFTDSNTGSLTYVEIYNGTGVTKNLSAYNLKTANNGGAYGFTLPLSNVNLATGSTYVVALGNDSSCAAIPGGNGSYGAQSSGSGSVNFTSGGHDHVGLFNGATLIDSWGIFGNNNWAPGTVSTEGATFRRRNTAALIPNPTYSNPDWDIIDYLNNGASACASNDYSDIGIYNFLAGIPPTVTLHPNYIPSCKTASLTVAGTEGFVGTNSLIYQWFAIAPGIATPWIPITDGALYSGTTSVTLNLLNTTTLVGYQYYCQIRDNSSTCYAASNAAMITVGTTTTWTDSWNNGAPTFNKAVIISANYDTAPAAQGSFEACSVAITGGNTLTVRGNTYVSIQNDLTVDANATLLVEDNGTLVQIDDAGVNTNNGTVNIKRISTIRRQDYVYWSSPISGFSVSNVSPLTQANYILKWNPIGANTNGGEGLWVTTAETMVPGKGYILRGPSTFDLVTPADMTASFLGTTTTQKPNNGIITPTISRGTDLNAGSAGPNGIIRTVRDDNFNLVGNPYASAIDAVDFLTLNNNIEGAIYLWTHGSLPSSAITDPFYGNYVYNYTSSDYITYNISGASSGPSAFNGFVSSGQSFFVVMNPGATGSQTVTFNNAMRRDALTNTYYDNTYFYRNNNPITQFGQSLEKNRIWLDLIGSNGNVNRTLVGYIEGATNEKDRLFDAEVKVGNAQNFYSIIGDNTFVNQGKSVPFTTTDKVPLGLQLTNATQYTIAISAIDGLFQNQNQSIYLEDKYLNIIHDLKVAPYYFTSIAGRFDDRFVIRYTNLLLENEDFDFINNNVVVAVSNQQINIKSSFEEIKEILVYDILGRKVYENAKINSNLFSISDVVSNHQSLIVKITLFNGQVITRKIIL